MSGNESEVEGVSVLPSGWYLGAHGDPVAVFEADSPRLVLHADGTVTWHRGPIPEPTQARP